jgi:hypothetical protein
MFDEIIVCKRNTISAAKGFRSSTLNSDIINQGYYLQELEKSVNTEITQNRQILMVDKAIYQLNAKKINLDDYYDLLNEALLQTIPKGRTMIKGKGYYTSGELDCIYSMAAVAHMKKDNAKESIYRTFFESILKSGIPIKMFTQSSILRWLSISYLIEKKYDEAKNYALIGIKNLLLKSRIRLLSVLMHDIAEIDEIKTGNSNLEMKKKLRENLYTLAVFTGNENASKYIYNEIQHMGQ